MSNFIFQSEINNNGVGTEKAAYKGLLVDLAKSGVVLDEIEIDTSGLFNIRIRYKVSGPEPEIDRFIALRKRR